MLHLVPVCSRPLWQVQAWLGVFQRAAPFTAQVFRGMWIVEHQSAELMATNIGCLCRMRSRLCSGAGWAEQQGLGAHVDVSVGTFSKAFGCHGGFVAGSAALIAFLTNRGRPYVFSTALPAPVAAGALAALRASQQVRDRC